MSEIERSMAGGHHGKGGSPWPTRPWPVFGSTGTYQGKTGKILNVMNGDLQISFDGKVLNCPYDEVEIHAPEKGFDPATVAINRPVHGIEASTAAAKPLALRTARLTKAQVNYRVATQPNEHCTNCVHVESRAGSDSTCALVEGTVDGQHVCDRFEPPGVRNWEEWDNEHQSAGFGALGFADHLKQSEGLKAGLHSVLGAMHAASLHLHQKVAFDQAEHANMNTHASRTQLAASHGETAARLHEFANGLDDAKMNEDAERARLAERAHMSAAGSAIRGDRGGALKSTLEANAHLQALNHGTGKRSWDEWDEEHGGGGLPGFGGPGSAGGKTPKQFAEGAAWGHAYGEAGKAAEAAHSAAEGGKGGKKGSGAIDPVTGKLKKALGIPGLLTKGQKKAMSKGGGGQGQFSGTGGGGPAKKVKSYTPEETAAYNAKKQAQDAARWKAQKEKNDTYAASRSQYAGGYDKRDLHEEGTWGEQTHKSRYGTVMFDGKGHVLIREPSGHYDGIAASFSKGGRDPGEHPAMTAIRESEEETGITPRIVGHIEGGFSGSGSGSVNHYYVAVPADKPFDGSMMNGETSRLAWATPKQADHAMQGGTNASGINRDRRTLRAAVATYERLHPKDPKSEPLDPVPPLKTPSPSASVIQKSKVAAPTVLSDVSHSPTQESDLDHMIKVKGPRGSNPSQWYEDHNGQHYLLKQADSDDHAENEVAVGATYAAAGIPAPHTNVITMEDGTKHIVSKGLSGLHRWTTTPSNQAEARKGFGVDSLVSNWDTLGLINDNAFTTSKGNVVRLDHGGGGFYRARGAWKGDSFEAGKPWVDHTTLRTSKQGREFYGAPPGAHDDEMQASLKAAKNLDLDKVDKTMADRGVSKEFRDDYLDVLRDRQSQISDEGHVTPAQVTAKEAWGQAGAKAEEAEHTEKGYKGVWYPGMKLPGEEDRAAATAFWDVEELETRSWEEWNEEHPYVPNGLPGFGGPGSAGGHTPAEFAHGAAWGHAYGEAGAAAQKAKAAEAHAEAIGKPSKKVSAPSHLTPAEKAERDALADKFAKQADELPHHGYAKGGAGGRRDRFIRGFVNARLKAHDANMHPSEAEARSIMHKDQTHTMLHNPNRAEKAGYAAGYHAHAIGWGEEQSPTAEKGGSSDEDLAAKAKTEHVDPKHHAHYQKGVADANAYVNKYNPSATSLGVFQQNHLESAYHPTATEASKAEHLGAAYAYGVHKIIADNKPAPLSDEEHAALKAKNAVALAKVHDDAYAEAKQHLENGTKTPKELLQESYPDVHNPFSHAIPDKHSSLEHEAAGKGIQKAVSEHVMGPDDDAHTIEAGQASTGVHLKKAENLKVGDVVVHNGAAHAVTHTWSPAMGSQFNGTMGLQNIHTGEKTSTSHTSKEHPFVMAKHDEEEAPNPPAHSDLLPQKQAVKNTKAGDVFHGGFKVLSIQHPQNGNLGHINLKGPEGTITEHEANASHTMSNVIKGHEQQLAKQEANASGSDLSQAVYSITKSRLNNGLRTVEDVKDEIAAHKSAIDWAKSKGYKHSWHDAAMTGKDMALQDHTPEALDTPAESAYDYKPKTVLPVLGKAKKYQELQVGDKYYQATHHAKAAPSNLATVTATNHENGKITSKLMVSGKETTGGYFHDADVIEAEKKADKQASTLESSKVSAKEVTPVVAPVGHIGTASDEELQDAHDEGWNKANADAKATELDVDELHHHAALAQSMGDAIKPETKTQELDQAHLHGQAASYKFLSENPHHLPHLNKKAKAPVAKKVAKSITSPEEVELPKHESELGIMKHVAVGGTFANGETAPGLGYQGGQWYEHLGTGKAYLVKGSQSSEHAENEVAAHLLYKQAGIETPKTGLITMNNGEKRVISEYKPGLTPIGPTHPGDEVSKNVTPAIQKEARKGFGTDALLGHYDIFGRTDGTTGRNLFKNAAGKLVRLDLAGTGRFRGAGSHKGKSLWSVGDWANHPDEHNSYVTQFAEDKGKKLVYGVTKGHEMNALKSDKDVKASVQHAADLDLAKHHQDMLDAGISKKFADEQVAVLGARQNTLKEKGLATGEVKPVVGKSESAISPNLSDALGEHESAPPAIKASQLEPGDVFHTAMGDHTVSVVKQHPANPQSLEVHTVETSTPALFHKEFEFAPGAVTKTAKGGDVGYENGHAAGVKTGENMEKNSGFGPTAIHEEAEKLAHSMTNSNEFTKGIVDGLHTHANKMVISNNAASQVPKADTNYPKVSDSARYEKTSGTSNKFYEMTVHDHGDHFTHTTRYGSMLPGAHVNEKTKEFPTYQKALDAHVKSINIRIEHGYSHMGQAHDKTVVGGVQQSMSAPKVVENLNKLPTTVEGAPAGTKWTTVGGAHYIKQANGDITFHNKSGKLIHTHTNPAETEPAIESLVGVKKELPSEPNVKAAPGNPYEPGEPLHQTYNDHYADAAAKFASKYGSLHADLLNAQNNIGNSKDEAEKAFAKGNHIDAAHYLAWAKAYEDGIAAHPASLHDDIEDAGSSYDAGHAAGYEQGKGMLEMDSHTPSDVHQWANENSAKATNPQEDGYSAGLHAAATEAEEETHGQLGEFQQHPADLKTGDVYEHLGGAYKVTQAPINSGSTVHVANKLGIDGHGETAVHVFPAHAVLPIHSYATPEEAPHVPTTGLAPSTTSKGSVPGAVTPGHEEHYITGHHQGYMHGQHMVGPEGKPHVAPKYLASNVYYKKAKEALTAGDATEHAKNLGFAHGLAQVTKEKKAEAAGKPIPKSVMKSVAAPKAPAGPQMTTWTNPTHGTPGSGSVHHWNKLSDGTMHAYYGPSEAKGPDYTHAAGAKGGSDVEKLLNEPGKAWVKSTSDAPKPVAEAPDVNVFGTQMKHEDAQDLLTNLKEDAGTAGLPKPLNVYLNQLGLGNAKISDEWTKAHQGALKINSAQDSTKTWMDELEKQLNGSPATTGAAKELEPTHDVFGVPVTSEQAQKALEMFYAGAPNPKFTGADGLDPHGALQQVLGKKNLGDEIQHVNFKDIHDKLQEVAGGAQSKPNVTVYGHEFTHENALKLQKYYKEHGDNFYGVSDISTKAKAPSENHGHNIHTGHDNGEWSEKGGSTPNFFKELDKQLGAAPAAPTPVQEPYGGIVKQWGYTGKDAGYKSIHYTKNGDGSWDKWNGNVLVEHKDAGTSSAKSLDKSLGKGTNSYWGEEPVTASHTGASSPASTVTPSTAGPKYTKKSTSVMAKNLKVGDQILLSGQHHEVVATNKHGFQTNVKHSATGTVKDIQTHYGKTATTKVTKLHPGHHLYKDAEASTTAQSKPPIPTSSYVPGSMNIKGTPINPVLSPSAVAATPSEKFLEQWTPAHKFKQPGVQAPFPLKVTVPEDELKKTTSYKLAHASALAHSKGFSKEEAQIASEEAMKKFNDPLLVSPAEQAHSLGLAHGYASVTGVKAKPGKAKSVAEVMQMPEYAAAVSAAKAAADNGMVSRDLYEKAGQFKEATGDANLANHLAWQAQAEQVDQAENEYPEIKIDTGNPDLSESQISTMNSLAQSKGGSGSESDLQKWAYDQGRAQGIEEANGSVTSGATAGDVEAAALKYDALASQATGLLKNRLEGIAHALHRVAAATHSGSGTITTTASQHSAKPDVQYHVITAAEKSGVTGVKYVSSYGGYHQSFTSLEQSAISNFTGPSRFTSGDSGSGFYPALNRGLSGKDIGTGSGADMARALLHAAAMKSTPSKNTIYRGTEGGEFSAGQFEKMQQQLANGEKPTLSYPLASMSYNPNLGGWASRPYRYYIDAGAFTLDIAQHSGHSERETLAGGLYEIYKIEKVGNQNRIHMRQIVHYGQ